MYAGWGRGGQRVSLLKQSPRGDGAWRGPQKSAVDPPLSSSRAYLAAFFAISVPYVLVPLGQFHPVPVPHLQE